jgi:hypothetical protein
MASSISIRTIRKPRLFINPSSQVTEKATSKLPNDDSTFGNATKGYEAILNFSAIPVWTYVTARHVEPHMSNTIKKPT